jgi:nucleotide-binding universal stress UspA family protein
VAVAENVMKTTDANAMNPDATTMVSLRNILFATDFSAVSENALRYAEVIARRYGSKIFAAHVITPESYALAPPETWVSASNVLEDAARKEIHDLGLRLAAFPHQVLLLHGEIWETLASVIDNHQIDLMVIGTHGRTGFEKLLLGSVAEQIFRQASCPVLTVGPKATGRVPYELDPRSILYATDFSPESLAAAPYAISLAEEYQAKLTFLHVMQEARGPLDATQAAVAEKTEQLKHLIPQEAGLWCHPEYLVRFGAPADRILDVAFDQGAGLIVLGTRSARGHVVAATHTQRATAHKVVAHAKCPVLTVRG